MTRPLRAPRVSAEAREPRRVELAPLPEVHDDGCMCPECCDDDDAPTAYELHRADSEDLDRELSRMAWRS